MGKWSRLRDLGAALRSGKNAAPVSGRSGILAGMLGKSNHTFDLGSETASRDAAAAR
jgi:hypothetical protein